MTTAPVEIAIEIPDDDAFGSQEFLPDKKLTAIGQWLVDEAPEVALAGPFTVHYLWKRKGGASKGAPVLGKCVKPSGALKFYAQADFIVWLAADHIFLAEFDNTQIQAVVFHELKHIGQDDEGNATIEPHDAEVFTDELARYGPWKPDLRGLVETAQQLEMPL